MKEGKWVTAGATVSPTGAAPSSCNGSCHTLSAIPVIDGGGA